MDMGDLIEEVVITDDHEWPKLISAIRAIIFQCFTILLWLIISVPCLPLFVLGLFIWGLPPIIPSWLTFCKFFIAVFTEGKTFHLVIKFYCCWFSLTSWSKHLSMGCVGIQMKWYVPLTIRLLWRIQYSCWHHLIVDPLSYLITCKITQRTSFLPQ